MIFWFVFQLFLDKCIHIIHYHTRLFNCRSLFIYYRAKIFLEDGHLTIAAQSNKNLTLKTSGTKAGIYLKADTPLTEDHLPKLSSGLGGVTAEEAIARGIFLI